MLTALILSGLPVLIFTSVGWTARRLPLLQALPDDGFWLAIAV